MTNDIFQINENLPDNTTATVCGKTETRWMLNLQIGFHCGLNDWR